MCARGLSGQRWQECAPHRVRTGDSCRYVINLIQDNNFSDVLRVVMTAFCAQKGPARSLTHPSSISTRAATHPHSVCVCLCLYVCVCSLYLNQRCAHGDCRVSTTTTTAKHTHTSQPALRARRLQAYRGIGGGGSGNVNAGIESLQHTHTHRHTHTRTDTHTNTHMPDEICIFYTHICRIMVKRAACRLRSTLALGHPRH